MFTKSISRVREVAALVAGHVYEVSSRPTSCSLPRQLPSPLALALTCKEKTRREHSVATPGVLWPRRDDSTPDVIFTEDGFHGYSTLSHTDILLTIDDHEDSALSLARTSQFLASDLQPYLCACERRHGTAYKAESRDHIVDQSGADRLARTNSLISN